MSIRLANLSCSVIIRLFLYSYFTAFFCTIDAVYGSNWKLFYEIKLYKWAKPPLYLYIPATQEKVTKKMALNAKNTFLMPFPYIL